MFVIPGPYPLFVGYIYHLHYFSQSVYGVEYREAGYTRSLRKIAVHLHRSTLLGWITMTRPDPTKPDSTRYVNPLGRANDRSG